MRKTTVIRSFLIGAALLAPSVAFAGDPVPADLTVTVPYATFADFTLSATDPDGDIVTFSLLNAPANGSLSGTVPNLRYTPNPNFRGPDSFSYRADDGTGNLVDADVTIDVSPPTPNAIYKIDGIVRGTSGVYGDDTVSFAGLADGPHVLTIEATDAGGGTAFASLNFTIDSVPPTIVWRDHPGFPSDTKKVRLNIDQRVQAIDYPISGTDRVQAVELLVPGIVDPVAMAPDSSWPLGAPESYIWAKRNLDTRLIPNGPQTISARAYDRAGNLTAPVITYPVIIDNSIPTVTLTPLPAMVRGVVNIVATAADAVTSITQMKVILSGPSENVVFSTPSASLNYALNTAAFGDGPWTVRVEAYDEAVDMTTSVVGNKGIATQAIVIDNSAPSVVINTPADNTPGLVTLSELQVTASDIHGIATRKVFVKRNAGAFAERAITYTAPDRWIFNAPLDEDGSYLIRAVAEDSVGNANTPPSAGGADELVVNLLGINDPPTANAGPDQTVAERAAVSLAGSGADPESGLLTYLWSQVSGPSVTLSNTGIANPTFTAPFVNSNQVIRLRLRVTDNQGLFAEDTVDITVQNGAFGNQSPTSNAGVDQTVTERAVVSLAGSGTDPEGAAVSYAWSQVSGPSITLSNAGIANPTFTAPYVNANQVVQLRLRVTDDLGASTDDFINVTVQNGGFINQSPTSNAGPDQTVNERASVALNGSGTDPENGAINYLWTQVSGPTATLSANNIANPTFTAPFVNANQVIRLRLRVSDDQGAFADDTIDVTVQNGSFGNQPPTANAGPDQTVNEQVLVSLTATGADPESAPVNYLWTQVSGPSVTLSNTGAANPTFTSPFVNSNRVISLRVRVTDDQGAFAEDVIDVTVQNGGFGNQSPTSNAGPDQTANERAVVSLSGAGADPEGASVSYLWMQVSGPAITLSNSGIANPTFTAPFVNGNQVVRLRLRVTDDLGAFAEDLIDVTVLDCCFVNQPPTSNAGLDQTVNERAVVSLSGSGTDPEGATINYSWTQESGPAISLSADNIANPTFTAPYVNSNQVIRLRLRVSDDLGLFAEDTVDVTVQNGASGNQDPTANAGPNQTVDELTNVGLSGSGSDPENGVLNYLWSQVSGPAVTLSANNIANPTFTAPSVSSDGMVRLRLRVTDDQGAFAEDLVDINVNDVGSGGNNPPTANAGPDQSVDERDVAQLAGGGADPELGPLTYAWTQVSGPAVTLNNAGVANPTFTAPYVNANQVVRLRLRVTDDQGAFADDLIDVTVQNGSSGNQSPTANAGPNQTVDEQNLVQLAGSGSDPENGTLGYAWTQVSGPAVTLNNAGIANPAFTAPYVNSAQVIRFRLRVSDDQTAFADDLIDITVNDAAGGNNPPTANAGPNQTVNEQVLVSLSGSGTDPESAPLTYLWTQVSGPSITLNNAAVANPTFTSPFVNGNQVIRLRLRVTDDLGAFAEDLIDVTVQNGASGNQPPTSNAGPDQTVNELTTVNLSGSGSDPESGFITYAWSQVSGPSVTLSAGNIANPTFTAPSVSGPSLVRLRLRVTDDQGAFADDSVDIIVNDVGSGGNNPPTANAGPDQTVNEQVLVFLSGSGTDPESGLLSYLWTQVSGPSIALSNAAIANPTFTAPFVNANQVVRLRLRVIDDQGAFAEDLIDVTVQNGASGNQTPTANAGPDQSVSERALVTLNGSGTDPENAAMTYLWTQDSGPAITLSAGDIANPTFTAPFVNGNQVVRLRLRVTDDLGAFAEDLVDVTVQNGGFGNQTPAANAGPDQTIDELLTVSLGGAGSDPESGLITYLWSQISGPAVTLSANNVANPTFTAPAVAALSVVRLQLRVSDDQGAFADDIIDITINDADGSGNSAPTVTIQSPTNMAYVRGGSTPIDIRATDDVGVTEVRVKIDGGAEQAAAANGVNLYRYNWNTNSPTAEGSHTIEAIARDLQSLTTRQMITVFVDRTMPTIALTPNDGVIVQGNVNIQTTATDDRALVFVEIIIDGTQVTSRNVTGTSTAFTYSWDTLGLPEGTHQVLVRAVDAAGNIRTTLHDVTVRNLGGANPLPDFTWMAPAPFTPPAIAPRIRGSAPLQINVTVGDPILSVQFSIDGAPLAGPVVNTPGTGIWTYSLDTTAGYAEGNHTLAALVTNAEGSTSKSVTAFIDNTPPTVTIESPSNNQILFLVNNLIAHANDNGNPIDEVLFQINTQDVALRPGNASPANDTYSYQMDTEALLPDGTRRWPDSPYVPPTTPTYTLTVTAFDKARNASLPVTINFGIDNTHIPAAPGAVVVFNPTGFVSGNAGNEIWADVQNVAIDPSSFNNQGTRALQVFVKRNSADDFERLELPVRLVGNRMIIDEPMPANVEYQLVARVMGTVGATTGLIQASATGIKAMDDATGGTVSSADGLLLLNIPPNSLTRDIYLRIPKMTSRPNWMEQADLSFNQLYEGHSVVAGPYQVEGRISMTGGAIYDEVAESEIGVRHQIPTANIPPTLQSMLLQIQEARQTADSNFWHPLGTSNSSTQNSSFRTVNGTTRRLGIFRVTRFAAPGSGVTEVFNYSNPFHPDEGPTNITYMLGDPEDVTLVIYDALGNLVLKQTFPAGSPGGALGPNTIQWDGRNGSGDFVASGSYIARLIAGSSKATRKIGVVR